MNIIKNFITPELSSHLAKELTDTISISLTRSSFPLPFFLIIANIFQLNLWSWQWWCGWFITKTLLIFFFLKLSGGKLELWIKSFTHSHFWSNNSISRNLYQWNKLRLCAKNSHKVSTSSSRSTAPPGGPQPRPARRSLPWSLPALRSSFFRQRLHRGRQG